MKSELLIQLAKDKFKELEHKDFEWRSFYNGFLEGFAKCQSKIEQEKLITDIMKGDEEIGGYD